jgi:hypothetical protein
MFAGVTPPIGSTPGVLETVMPGDVAFYAQVARSMQGWGWGVPAPSNSTS